MTKICNCNASKQVTVKKNTRKYCCYSLWDGFYAWKQLLLSAHLSHRNSVRLSHRWISQKRCKLGSPNLYRRLPGSL